MDRVFQKYPETDKGACTLVFKNFLKKQKEWILVYDRMDCYWNLFIGINYASLEFIRKKLQLQKID